MNEIPYNLREQMINSIPDIEEPADSEVFYWVYKHLHDRFGRASCGLVRDWMNERNFKTSRGNPVSRMTVWRAMNKTSDGRKLLNRTIRRTGH